MHKTITRTLLLLSFLCAHHSTKCAANTPIQHLKKFTVVNKTNTSKTFLYQDVTQNKCKQVHVLPKSTKIIFAIPHATGALYMHQIISPELPIHMKTITILPHANALVIRKEFYV